MKKIKQFVFTMMLITAATARAQVGIGTTTPIMKLHVAGANSGVVLFENTQALSVGVSTGLYFKTGSGPNAYTGALKTIGQSTAKSRIGIFTFSDGSPNGLLERLSITNSGNVGIGTLTPTAKLEVLGQLKSTNSGYGLLQSDGGTTLGTYIDGFDAGWFGTLSNHPLWFFTNNGYAALALDTTGNLGVGTTAPANKLSVNGNANVSGNMAIGATVPDGSAQLDISSKTKGFLPPRMTIAQRVAIVNPTVGLVIFCNECDELQVFNGIIWKNMNGVIACSTPMPQTVTICNQTWMNKNLDVDKYKNGDPIPLVTNNATWAALTTGAYCYYNNDSATYAAMYGKLYNWYAVNDPRGLAPAGWHVPDDLEWTALETCLGGFSVAGGAMKETGTTHWLAPNNAATNSSGFTGLPGGFRAYDGSFNNVGGNAKWWITGERSTISAYSRYLSFYFGNFTKSYYNKLEGTSVRCIRN